MKTIAKTYLALGAACLWVFILACHFEGNRQPVDIDTVTRFPNHSEIQRDTVPDNRLIEPRFIDN